VNGPLIIRPSAEMDIIEAAGWSENQQVGLGTEFINEIQDAINRVRTRPLAYLRIRRNPAIHRILARRFPYRLFYIVQKDAVVIFAILHASRHDRHWIRRIKVDE